VAGMTGFLALGFDRIRRHAKVKCIAVFTIRDSWFFCRQAILYQRLNLLEILMLF
jgi:hypothetical protein